MSRRLICLLLFPPLLAGLACEVLGLSEPTPIATVAWAPVPAPAVNAAPPIPSPTVNVLATIEAIVQATIEASTVDEPEGRPAQISGMEAIARMNLFFFEKVNPAMKRSNRYLDKVGAHGCTPFRAKPRGCSDDEIATYDLGKNEAQYWVAIKLGSKNAQYQGKGTWIITIKASKNIDEERWALFESGDIPPSKIKD